MQSVRQRRGKGSRTAGLVRAVQFVWSAGPGWMAAAVFLLVLQATLPLLSLYLLKKIVDALTASAAVPGKALAFHHLAGMIALAAGAALAAAAVRAVAAYVTEAQAQQVTNRMLGVIEAKSVEMDLSFYENPEFHDTLHRAQQEAPFRPTRIVGSLLQMGQSVISLLAIAGLLLTTLHWPFLLILVATALPGLLLRVVNSRSLYRLRAHLTHMERQVQYYSSMLTLEHYAKEVRLFGLGPLFMERAGQMREGLRLARLQMTARRAGGDFAGQTFAACAVFGGLAFLAHETLFGVFTLGSMIMYYTALQRGQSVMGELSGGFAEFYENNLFLSNLYEFLDLPPKLTAPDPPLPVPSPPVQGIVLEHVSFRYEGGIKEVLSDVSLTIRAGETVALVGENGSGKTTLIKLLCRLYDPTGGRITLDGTDLRECRAEEVRRQIGVVFQDYVHYYQTARENIWLGNAEAPPDPARLMKAACDSGAHEVIAPLPQGYETILGNWFREGQELSIGQWQKVALARAFFRDAPIMVLDEPTSALDAEAEYEVFDRFRHLVHGKTAILISHRLSTVKMADCIYVLEDGRIVEAGPHEALISQGGAYARLFEIQAQQYR